MRLNPFARADRSAKTIKTRGSGFGGDTISIADPLAAALFGYGESRDVHAPPVSPMLAMNLSAVYRAGSILSGAIAQLPLRTLETDPATDVKVRVRSTLDSPGGQWGPTSFEWMELCTLTMVFEGEVFYQPIYDNVGRLMSFWRVPRHMVTDVRWDPDNAGEKLYDVIGLGTVTSREFVQIMDMSLDGLRGISRISLARMGLRAGISGDESAYTSMRNGPTVAGVLTPANGDDFDPTELPEMRREVNSKLMGPRNAGQLPIVNRALTLQQWSISNADQQWLETRVFTIDEIGRWMGIPPHLLGLTEKSTSWGQGIESQNRGLARYTLIPITARIEQRLSRWIPWNQTAEFDYTAFVRPTPEQEINLLIQEVNSGLLTLNEGRRIRNRPPVDGGDIPRIPAGAAPPVAAEDLEETPKGETPEGEKGGAL